MPYFSNEDLPENITNHLPKRAQTIYREAFNKAYHQHNNNDVVAFKIAWTVVKLSYEKNEKGKWVKKKSKK